jgi:hypothetical protein
MLRKSHGTNFFHVKFLDYPNIKCQNGPVLPPAQVFYFNGQALHFHIYYLFVAINVLFLSRDEPGIHKENS